MIWSGYIVVRYGEVWYGMVSYGVIRSCEAGKYVVSAGGATGDKVQVGEHSGAAVQ